MEMDYKTYVGLWLDGLYDEISFWNTYISSCGAIGGRREAWFDYINPNRKFVLDDLLHEGEEIVRFADIGFGPFSRCGRKSNKCEIDITCIDPLGEIYEILKNRYGINNGNFIQRGFIEFLDCQFASNYFDIVHMSNSLDHCFDAVYGIYQLLNICKIGGKVVLRHHENEAERLGYTGLHLWNLSLHNAENSFVIWNGTVRINVCDMFAEYADFELFPDIVEPGGTWVYNQVVLTKRKDITISPPDKRLLEFLLAIYDKFSRVNLEMVDDGNGKIVQRCRQRIKREIEAGQYDERIIKWAKSGRIVIYGLGILGRALLDRHYIGQNVIALDRKDREYRGVRTVRPESYIPLEGDKIVITIVVDDYIKNNFLRDQCLNNVVFLM